MRKLLLLLLVAFLLLPSLSWGACVVGTYGFTARDKGCGDAACIAEGLNDYWFGQACGGGNFCTLIGYGVNPNGGCYNWNSRQDCLATLLRCSTQDEADSAKCALNPEAEGCTDACTEYKTSCEANGGHFSGSVNYAGVCVGGCDLCSTEPYKEALRLNAQGCCEAGFKPGAHCTSPPVVTGSVSYSGLVNLTGCEVDFWQQKKVCEEFLDSLNETSSSSSSVPVSSSSSVSEYCKLFPDDLACICADDSTRPECAYLRSSSSEGSPAGSSGSEGGEGSSGSGGGEGGEGSSGSGGGGLGGGDFEYDYRDSLHKIIRATTRIAGNTEGLGDSLGVIAQILRFARCLWDDCTNYDSLGIPEGVEPDTSGWLGGMPESVDSLAGVMGGVDSLSMGDAGTGIDSGAVDSAFTGLRGQVGAVFGDDGNNPARKFGDSLAGIIENKFPTSAWGYSQNCPTSLTKNVTIDMGRFGEINSNTSLGRFLCSPVSGLGLSLGTIARNLFKLLLTISMAFYLYRFCMKGGKD